MTLLTKKAKRPRRKESPTVRNFRQNFAVSLAADGRSLRGFARDMKMSAAHISRIRSGLPYSDNGKPLVPGLDAADKLAKALGQELWQMLLPQPEFMRLAKTSLEEARQRRLTPQPPE